MEIPPIHDPSGYSQQENDPWQAIYDSFQFCIKQRSSFGGVTALADYTKTIGTLVEMAPDSPFKRAFSQLAADIGRGASVSTLNQDLQKVSSCSPPSFTDAQVQEAVKEGFSRFLSLFSDGTKPQSHLMEAMTFYLAIGDLSNLSGAVYSQVRGLEQQFNYDAVYDNYVQKPGTDNAAALADAIRNIMNNL